MEMSDIIEFSMPYLLWGTSTLYIFHQMYKVFLIIAEHYQFNN